MRTLTPMALAALLASASTCQAQDGSFDTGFAGTGRVLVDVSDGPGDDGKVLHIQPDGKLLMGGTCQKGEVQGSTTFFFPKFCATRLRADGSYDTTFGPGGVGYIRFDRFETDGSGFPHNSALQDMLLLADGRIVFVGAPTALDEVLVAVLRADGSALDTSVAGVGHFSFKYGGRRSSGNSLLAQPDGRILVAGQVTGPNNNPDMAVQRFLPDFSVDTGFGTAGYRSVAFDIGGPSGDNSDTVFDVALQDDGRIVLAGFAVATTAGTGVLEGAVARLTAAGQLDTTFGPNQDGRVRIALNGFAGVTAVRVDRQGRIVVAGLAADPVTGRNRCMIDRRLGNGNRDPAFNASGGAARPQLFSMPNGSGEHACILYDLALQPDDSILTVGVTSRTVDSSDTYFGAARLTPTGALDPTFGSGGRSFSAFSALANRSDQATSVAIGNGGLMIAGSSTNGAGSRIQFGLARLRLDRLFASGFE